MQVTMSLKHKKNVSTNVKFVCVKAIEPYWRSGDIAPFIFDLGPLWK